MKLHRRLRARLALAVSLLAAGLLAEAAGDYGLPVVSVDFSVDGPGDNVDDPCFWVHPTDPTQSLMFVTAKESGLVEVFNVSTGALVDTITSFDRPNNCAVDGDLLLTTDRDAGNVKIHHLPDLAYVGLMASDSHKPYGVSVLHTPAGASHMYITDGKDGTVRVYDLATRGLVRTFQPNFGLEIEPIVADDHYQRVFVSREEGAGHGIGVFTPEGTLTREIGDTAFTHDTEGLAIYACSTDGYLVASDQDPDATEFEVFDRATLSHLGTFLLRQGADAYTRATDGIDILQAPLARFPGGVLATCDGCGDKLPDEMDLVPWERVAEAMKLDVCPNGVAPDCRTAPCRKRMLAVADATVAAATPDTPAGSDLSLHTAGPGEEQTLLRFAVPDLTGYDVLEAVVRLVGDGTRARASFSSLYATSAAWDEATVTWSTRPPLPGLAISGAGFQSASLVVDLDARAALGAGGRTVDFLVRSSDGASYRSREAGESPPALILQLRESSPPTIAIAAPAADVTVGVGTSVHLQASASDPEDGDLSARIVWTSNLTGALGSGPTLDVVLPAGQHRITAAVTDGAFLTRSATVEVRVTSDCPEPCDDGDHCTDDTCTPTGCAHVESPALTPAQVLCGVENLQGGTLLPPLQRRLERVRNALAAAHRAGGTRTCLRRARAAARAAKALEKLVARFSARPAGLPGGGGIAIESQRLRLRAEAMASAFCR